MAGLCRVHSRRAFCKAWFDVTPPGLSSSSTPCAPVRRARGPRHASYPRSRVASSISRSSRCRARPFVVHEHVCVGTVWIVQALEQQRVEEACLLVQRTLGRFDWSPDRREVDLGVRVVGRDLDAGQGDDARPAGPAPRAGSSPPGRAGSDRRRAIHDRASSMASLLLIQKVRPVPPANFFNLHRAKVVCTFARPLQGTCDFLDLEELQLIAFLDVVVVLELDTALEALP